jgi:hypothetical protein
LLPLLQVISKKRGKKFPFFCRRKKYILKSKKSTLITPDLSFKKKNLLSTHWEVPQISYGSAASKSSAAKLKSSLDS